MLQDLIRNSNIRQHIYTSDSRVSLEVAKGTLPSEVQLNYG